MMMLFYSEVNDFLTPSLKEELFVDTSRGSKLRINLDIIVPTITCDCMILFIIYNCFETSLSASIKQYTFFQCCS